MQQTKPFFIINKYRSTFRSTIVIEAVNFILSLTDSIIAGNAVSAEAFAAIGLIAPFLSISSFFSAITETGTILRFNFHIGKFEKDRANAYFSQGVCAALLTGVLYALLLLVFGNTVINSLAASEEIRGYLESYYYIILIVVMLKPIALLLDSMIISDGAENISFIANITQIVSNIVLSIVFVQFWGVAGIALATVISLLLFLLISCLHFFRKTNTLRFTFVWKLSDLAKIVRSGIVKASSYGFDAVFVYLINAYALARFGKESLIVLVVVEKLLGLLTFFMGLSMSCQPLVGTLRGEKNTKALRLLMNAAMQDMIAAGIVLSVIIFVGAPLIVPVFGIADGVLFDQAVAAMRIVSSTLVFHAILVLFFAYFVFINKQFLAFIICAIKSLLSSAVMVISLSIVMHSQVGMWIGFATAPVFAAALSVLIVLGRYGKKVFPFLIERDADDKIFIYSFAVNAENAADAAKAIEERLLEASVPPRTSALAGVITEDMLMVISERNAGSKKPLYAECTLMAEDDGARLILRDSGVIFDITDTDARIDSFRSYIVSNLMLKQDRKLYLTTTGYNRNELFFKY